MDQAWLALWSAEQPWHCRGRYCYREDIDQLTAYGDVVVMEGGVNTAGNLLVVNEQGAIASPSIPHEGLEILAEVLAVDVASTTVAGQDVVGSLAVANDRGVLLHRM